jgi:uncharacterized membrane protein
MALAHQAPARKIIPAPGYRRFLFPMAFGMLVLLFLAAPWPFAHKAHVALHGLCAQAPSHTLRFGDQALPFDSRMTGIYGGFLVSAVYFALRGRYRASAIPSKLSILLLAVFVGVMAVDGTNSLLLDMRMWHPYEPDNRLRLVTGLLTGVALAAVVAFLLASTLWRYPENSTRVVFGPREIALIVALQAPFAAICLWGQGELFVPVAMFLMVAALLAMTSLMLATVVLVRRAESTYVNVADLQGTAFVALLLAIAIMTLFSGGRFLMEHFVGPPALT